MQGNRLILLLHTYSILGSHKKTKQPFHSSNLTKKGHVGKRREIIFILLKKQTRKNTHFCLSLYLLHEDRRRIGIAKLEKLRFSFVSALAFHYLCKQRIQLTSYHESEN